MLGPAMAELDPRRYPRTARYLASLPQGLSSYGECRVRTYLHDGVREAFGKLGDETDLPAALRRQFRGEHEDAWMPEVEGSAMVHVIRDRMFESDEQYFAWTYENNGKIFQKPHYRVLMWLLAPTLLLSGAERRWGSLHQGSTVQASVARQGDHLVGQVGLRYPRGLFDELDMLNIRSGVKAAFVSSRAQGFVIGEARVGPEASSFEVSWAV